MKKEIIIINYEDDCEITKIGLKDERGDLLKKLANQLGLDLEVVCESVDIKVFTFNLLDELSAYTIIDSLSNEIVGNAYLPLNEDNAERFIKMSHFPLCYSDHHLFELIDLIGGSIELQEINFPLYW